MSSGSPKLDSLCVNTIRTLCIDAVRKANSGHPGTAMAMAPLIYCLWQRHLLFDPADPIWPNRDRFVLSAGHASTLLYSILHLAGTKAVDPDYEVLSRTRRWAAGRRRPVAPGEQIQLHAALCRYSSKISGSTQ